MGSLANADALQAVSGPIRLYPSNGCYDPKRYNVTFASCGSLSSFLSQDQGPIICFREVFDSKVDRRMVIIFDSFVTGADINDIGDCYRSYYQIYIYVFRYRYEDRLRGNCLDILRQFFETVPKIKEEAERLIPSIPNYYWPGAFNTKESLPEFIRRVWGDYFKYGLKISHFKTRDRRLWVSINNYRQNNPWPEDLECLSQRDLLRSKVDLFIMGSSEVLSPKELFSVVRKITRDGKLDHFTNNEMPKRKVIAVKKRKHPNHRAIS